MNEKTIKEFYNTNIEKYSAFRKRLVDKLQNEIKDLIFHIESRTKELSHIIDKVHLKSYTNIKEQLTDFVGVRIIVKDLLEVEQVCKYIKENYIVDEKNSVDKKGLLQEDKVGYLSVHFVVQFNEETLRVKENADYNGLKAEIQVRTILQHSWAELTHDKIYKRGTNLDSQTKREVNLIAGLLELADNEILRINERIEDFSKHLENCDGNLDAIKLNLFMSRNFSEAYFLNVEQCLQEITAMGINSLKDFSSLLTDRIKLYIKSNPYPRTYDSIVRNLLVIKDPDGYFSLEISPNSISRYSYNMYKHFVPCIDEIIKKYDVTIDSIK